MIFNKKMWSMFSLVLIVMILGFSGGCYEETADSKQAEETRKLMTEANNQVGMPNIVNFQQKKLMKSIYELCDKEDLICYAYIKSDYQGKLIFIGKCIGYGIPFSAQYSNPSTYSRVRVGEGHGFAHEVMPQPEPNGLFMPTSSSATWLMLIDPKTSKPRPAYFEPEIVVSPFPLSTD
jgi:hypothetical protein